ncbi:hypothetical protein [Ramlibacter rhizophilus]|nr:hypothetical protein [Ramlibacter rhizophilus]
MEPDLDHDRRYQSLLLSPWVWLGVVLCLVFWGLIGFLVWRWLA